MFAGIPIIGIVGGIGSGKSFVARLFGEFGCLVLDSDAQVRDAYRDPLVLRTLRQWWGDEAFDATGALDRPAVARKVFNDPAQRRRLEELIHPLVARARDAAMRESVERARSGSAPQPLAFVWDTPLLFEAGLRDACDAVIFVDAPYDLRLRRVRQTRGWGPDELARRENLQWPLDKKKQLSDDVLTNTAEATPDGSCPQGVNPVENADAGELRNQVGQVLSRVLSRMSRSPRL
jgi:dephospho-CoA kinase